MRFVARVISQPGNSDCASIHVMSLSLLCTLVDVRRADDDEVRDERGESGCEAGLRHEAELELVEAHGLVVAPPIPSCEHVVA